MDEIDAALDFKNVSIVANYVKERTRNAQFIVISLRNNMFEVGNRLVGIYKVDHVSHTLTIDPHAFEQGQQAASSASPSSSSFSPSAAAASSSSSSLSPSVASSSSRARGSSSFGVGVGVGAGAIMDED